MDNTFTIPYKKLAFGSLSAQEKALISLSEESLKNAHAPYSNFTVGSAIRIADGGVYSGSNQENAAYPSGLCAERVAMFKAKSESKKPIEAIVVIARNGKGEAADAFSCGSCRQVMMEYAGLQNEPIKILMRDKDENYIVLDDARLLLPFSFEAKALK